MKRIALGALVACALLVGCTDGDGAKRVLEGAGYTNIVTGGYAGFSCSDDDMVATSFTAIGPTGIEVSGAVCRGLIFKNATIRLD